MALAPGGRWVILDLMLPQWLPGSLVPLLIPLVRPFAVDDDVVRHRPWDAIRAAMRGCLTEPSWTELYLGFAYIAAGVRR